MNIICSRCCGRMPCDVANYRGYCAKCEEEMIREWRPEPKNVRTRTWAMLVIFGIVIAAGIAALARAGSW